MIIKTHWQPSYEPPTTRITHPSRNIDNGKRLGGVTACKTHAAIIQSPGLTAGDLIKVTGKQSSADYVKLLLQAGEIEVVMRRTKLGQHKAGVRHYYPKGHLQQGIAA